MLFPDYIFETSWEVCNKVGGIYTVLSTRAKTLQDRMKDHVIFLGPDCWYESQSPYFKQDDSLFADWQQKALVDGLKVKVGRWDIPGEPIAMLVDFREAYTHKDELYGKQTLQIRHNLHRHEDYQHDNIPIAYHTIHLCEYKPL